MTGRQLVVAWLGAFIVVTGLLLIPPHLYAPARPPLHAEVVVIGSSLMAYAVPTRGSGATSLLGDGRSHVRLARNSITEAQSLDFLGDALAAKPALIFVEVNPLIFDFADVAGRRACDGPRAAAMAFFRARRLQTIEIYQRLRGYPDWYALASDPVDRFSEQKIDLKAVRLGYPLRARSPCEQQRLQEFASLSRLQRTRLVFVLPPRSPYARAIIGPRVEVELVAAANRLAEQLGVSLFHPGPSWRNGEFVDHAHLNDSGRQHFCAELQRWWAAAR